MKKEKIEYIQQAQDAYNSWVELLPELEKNLQQWEEAEKLIQQLHKFYFNEEWVELHNYSQDISLDTKGNYSVLSEDAVWNAFYDKKQLTKRLVKLILTMIENEDN